MVIFVSIYFYINVLILFLEEARLGFSQKTPLFSVAFHPRHLSLSLFEFLSDVRNLWDVDGLGMRGSIWCNEFAFKMSLHPFFLLHFFLFLSSYKISPTCSLLSHSVMYAQTLLFHMRKHSSDIIFAQLWHRALQGSLTRTLELPAKQSLWWDTLCVNTSERWCMLLLSLIPVQNWSVHFLLYIYTFFLSNRWVEQWWILPFDQVFIEKHYYIWCNFNFIWL